MKVEGCVAVVTGGARGIGKAITQALLKNKAKVYIFKSYLSFLEYCQS